MKWYKVIVQSWQGSRKRAYHGDQHGTSLDNAMNRCVDTLRKNGWLNSSVTKFTVEIEFDEKRTKTFDEKKAWGPYR